MPLYSWSNNLATGIESIDSQHRILLDILNRVHAAMIEGKESEIDIAFHRLMEYTEFHFSHEEELFVQYKYPFAAAHKREHAKLKSEAQARLEEYKAGAITMLDILAFLIDWLQDHIIGSDKKFGDFVALKKDMISA